MAGKQFKSGLPKSAGTSPAQTPKLPAPLDPQLVDTLKEILKESNKESMSETIREIIREEITNLNLAMEDKFQDIGADICEFKKMIDNQHDKIREDIILAFKCLATKTGQLEEKIEENRLEIENKIELIQSKVDKTEDEMVLMQYRSMEVALRVRGLKEDRKENLMEIFSEVFAQELGAQPAEIAVQMDKIYRVNSWIARQKQLPRDVVIYFTNRGVRNEILQISYKQKFQIAGKELLILKEIPPKMLKGRKEYAFLVDELKRRQMQFRWDVPAGIVLNYNGQRYRLDTVLKARDFYEKALKAGQYPSSSPEMRRRKESDEARKREERKKAEEEEKLTQAQADDSTVAQDLLMLLDPKEILIPLEKRLEAKEQRQTRAATKRLEEEIKMQQSQIVQTQASAKTEAVGGARPKEKIRGDLQAVLQVLQDARDGKQ